MGERRASQTPKSPRVFGHPFGRNETVFHASHFATPLTPLVNLKCYGRSEGLLADSVVDLDAEDVSPRRNLFQREASA